MMADKPSPLVPTRRFPEFRDAPWWATGPLGDVLALEYGSPLPEKTRNSGDIPVIGSNGVIGYHDEALIAGPAVVIGRKGSVGQVNWVDSACYPIDTTYYVSLRNTRQTTLQYIYRLFEAMPLKELTDPGAVPGLNRNAVYGLTIALPEKAEQQKIADCLGSLDDLIAAEGRKLEALRRHKQGLLQQLFPQLGETVPRLRFQEFEDAPEWDEVTLGTLLDRPPEYGVNAPAVPFSESLPTYIRITDINDDGQFQSRARVSVDIVATDEQYLEDGDIVLARTGASVGKSYRYRQEDGPLVYAGFLIRVRPNPERLLSQFLAAYLSTWSYWDWVRLTSARSGQPGINGTEYASMPLPLPPDGRALAEQQKIADCLSVLDDHIGVQARKLDTLKQHKQGLLQQLFPSLEGE